MCVYTIYMLYYGWWESINQFIISRMLLKLGRADLAQLSDASTIPHHVPGFPASLITFLILSVAWQGINLSLPWIQVKDLREFLFSFPHLSWPLIQECDLFSFCKSMLFDEEDGDKMTRKRSTFYHPYFHLIIPKQRLIAALRFQL